MSDQIKTINRKFTCTECQNEVTVSADCKVGDVIECEFCGIEYEIIDSVSGEFILAIIEEEK